MGKVIGIDLGTTNSCVSVIEGEAPVVIVNAEGKRTTPSIVAFTENNERKVGDSAKRQSITNHKKTISSIKRFMGETYDQVKNEVANYSYSVINVAGQPKVEIDNKQYTPQEISAIILSKMKEMAEDYLGEKVTDAVITVPAYFNDSQRQATKEAGEIAGLNVLRIINEPTAAALAYGIDKTATEKTIAVFDLGGGTFDISILDIGDGVFEVKSTNGDTHLGGDDFDKVIIDFLVSEFKKEHGIDISKDAMALQRIKEAAEKAKIELSSSIETEINLPYLFPINGIPQHMVKKITRSDFEKMSDILLNRLKDPCIKAINDSGISRDKITDVLLVGGSTRIPIVQEIVKNIFGKEPSKNINPDEAVAIGAAIQGGVLTGEVKDVLLLDVTPLSLGIETMGNIMTKLIDANTTIPVTKSQIFSTAADNQPSVEIHVLQGERPMAQHNKSLGKFHLDNLPPAMRGIPQIEVTFDINANGILTVKAKDKGTNKEQEIRIEGSGKLDDAELTRMKRDAEQFAKQDALEKEKADLFNSADSLIFNTEKQLTDLKDKLSDDEILSIKNIVEELKNSRAANNEILVKEHMEKLSNIWNPIMEKIYKNVSQEPEVQEAQTV